MIGAWHFRKRVVTRADGTVRVFYEGRATIGAERLSVYAPTRDECMVKAAKLSGQIVLGLHQNPSELSLVEYLDAWLASRTSVLRPATIHVYARSIRLLKPRITTTRLTELTPLQVNVLYSHYTGSMLAQLDDMLRAACNEAVRAGILRASPMLGVKKPKRGKRQYRILSRDECLAFLREARADRLHALFVLALATGAREGELLALEWRDVDFANARIYINATLNEVGTTPLFVGPPKTEESRRTVDLPPGAVTALRTHLAAQVARGHAAGPVFASTNGTHMRKSNLLRRHYHPILERAGIKQPGQPAPIRFHDLRHTTATQLLEAGVPATRVAKLLGHANTKTTEAVYGHVLPGAGREVAKKLEELLGV